MTLSLNLPGYVIESLIYEGSRTLVYRGWRSIDRLRVILKSLRNPFPSFQELLQFRNRYTIARYLHCPGIATPVALEPYEHGYVLVTEDNGGMDLKQWIHQRSLSVSEILTIALQLADILHHLGEHRVVHKDIKPANILVCPPATPDQSNTLGIKLIDFGLASLLDWQTQDPNILEGTLAYLAPEQTGRMNRGIDYRSDFYSLGVTLYELLTGQLPFQSADPLALIHCHIAQPPRSMEEINPDIPERLSAIVLKLMAKNAEDRYQSARGLKQDLLYCWQQWQQHQSIPSFTLGQQDRSDRFVLPEKLYGREKEVQQLLATFDGIASPQSDPIRRSQGELLLVTGFSGIGKTAVIHEVHKPITRQHGYFIQGKFDQFNRHIPLSAFTQALRQLVGYILAESDAVIAQWRDRILTVAENNAAILLEVIPELEQAIGTQPPAPELSGLAAQNRFKHLFRAFIALFCQAEHPLVIFLDDLQWADAASLLLIDLLLQDQPYLLLLGAYRDHEVTATHPLRQAIDTWEKNAVVNTLQILPLPLADVNALVADTLHCPPERSLPLSQFIFRKTKGNPFFTLQFLKALHHDRHLVFNWQLGYWECDLSQINALSLTDDVVDFMIQRLQKLPPATQFVLQQAACVGNRFDLNVLAVICETTPDQVAMDLWAALREGFILAEKQTYQFVDDAALDSTPWTVANSNISTPDRLGYRFLHDRVQQAAYTLIEDTERPRTHLRIGQLLQKTLSSVEREEQLFTIVNQLNLGLPEVQDPIQQEHIARLNAAAARKARLSAAYEAALNYAETALSLLPPDGWQQDFSFTFALHLEAAGVASLRGLFQRSDVLVEMVLAHTPNLLDRVQAIVLRIQSRIARSQLLEALEEGRSLLHNLGVDLPEVPQPQDLQRILTQIQADIAHHPDLTQLPAMTDPQRLAAMSLLSHIASAAYIGAPPLYPLVVLLQIELSLRFGYAPETAYAFSTYGLILCAVQNDVVAGNQAADVALELFQRESSYPFRAKIINLVYPFVRVWRDHLKTGLEPLIQGYHAGVQSGDFEFAAYCLENYCQQAYFAGVTLPELAPVMTDYGNAIAHLNQTAALNFQQIVHQAVLNWLGDVEDPCQLRGHIYDEVHRLPEHEANGDRFSIGMLHTHKLVLNYHLVPPLDRKGVLDATVIADTTMITDADVIANAGVITDTEVIAEVTAQLAIADRAAESSPSIIGNVPYGAFCFYHALLLLRYSNHLQPHHHTALQQDLEKLAHWAIHAPITFSHRWDLIQAEQARIKGDRAAAIEYYDRAITEAERHDYLQDTALAQELAAYFYLEWGKPKVAKVYLQEAYGLYNRWGAKAKLEYFHTHFSAWLSPVTPEQPLLLHNSISSSNSFNRDLDLNTLLDAAQSLSRTLNLDQLLQDLTQKMLYHAGADYCAVILPDDQGGYRVEAIATPTQSDRCSIPLSEDLAPPHFPLKLIRYVKNSQELVVLDQLQTPLPVIDEGLQHLNPQSVLCFPLLNQGQCVGILYLSNQLTRNVFTADRLTILNFLGTEAAIAIENARLYTNLQASEARYQHLNQELEAIVAQRTADLATSNQDLEAFAYSISHDLRAPLRAISGFSTALAEDYPDQLDDMAQDYLNRIQRNAQRMNALIEGLLAFSRLTRSPLHCTPLHLTPMAEDIIANLRAAEPQRQVEIDIAPDLYVHGDPILMQVVLSNLLQNAWKFSTDRPLTQIQFSYQETPDGRVHFIKDNGVGFDMDYADKMFGVFQRLHSAEEFPGMGIGLASVHKAIQRQGGSLWAEGRVNRGATFFFKLPSP